MIVLAPSVALVLLALLCDPAAAQGGSLRHDIFERPVIGGAQGARAGPGAKGQAQPAAEEVEEDEPVDWNPELRAVIVAGADSRANVDGLILRIGDVVHGHRLVAVREREAIFQRGKQRYSLPLRGLKTPAEAALQPRVQEAPLPRGEKEANTSTRGTQ